MNSRLSKIYLIAFLASIFFTSAILQIPATRIDWKTLSDVQYKQRFNEAYELYFMYPTFGAKVKSLEGKLISIRGYMIPIDEYGRRYVISGKPMAQCFFCGGAGPESLIEIEFKKKGQRFKTDEIRTVTGVLHLNGNDVEHLSYLLTKTEVSQ